jgi:hypothetical protein
MSRHNERIIVQLGEEKIKTSILIKDVETTLI